MSLCAKWYMCVDDGCFVKIDTLHVYLLIAVIVGPFQMRLNGVTNCGELKVRHY